MYVGSTQRSLRSLHRRATLTLPLVQITGQVNVPRKCVENLRISHSKMDMFSRSWSKRFWTGFARGRVELWRCFQAPAPAKADSCASNCASVPKIVHSFFACGTAADHTFTPPLIAVGWACTILTCGSSFMVLLCPSDLPVGRSFARRYDT